MTRKCFFTKNIPATPLRMHLRAGCIIGLFVFLILWIFQPFGTYEYTIAFKALFLLGYGITSALSYNLFYTAGFLIFTKWFYQQKWNLVKETVTFLLVLSLIGFTSLLYHHHFVGNNPITFSAYFYFMKYVILVGIFPFSILYYHKWISSKLTVTKEAEYKTKEALTTISFFSNNKKEDPVCLTENEILFLKAEGNYVEIVSTENGQKQKYLVRNTLNQLAKQLPESGFSKVHRSYIANKTRAKSILIEGSSYKLQFDYEDLKIPVSRSAVKDIKTWFKF